MITPFYHGLFFGITIAAPVGPIAVLCIYRTLTRGWLTGLVSGLGAATADAFYGILAACGYTVTVHFLHSQLYWLRLVGSLLLGYLGVRILLAKSAVVEAAAISGKGFAEAYGTSALLTLTNPMTILVFAALITASKLGQSMPIPSPFLLVLGIFCGSACWWLFLCGGIGLLQRRITLSMMLWLNRVSGIAIIIYAVVMLMQK